MAHPPREKRTKPCSNCKRSKVKCKYTESLPCERCLKSGQVMTCQFVPKLPSLQLPHMDGFQNQPRPMGTTTSGLGAMNAMTPLKSMSPSAPALSAPLPPIIPNRQITKEDSPEWKSSMENRMNSFDRKLTDLVELIKSNQRMFVENREPEVTPPPKRTKLPSDFRDGYLTKDEANELFAFFKQYISQQLFGFDISQFSIDVLWETCPILVCAISVIASIHHPVHSAKATQLQVYLNELCSSLLFRGNPQNETEAFNTIVALILCSFWLSNSQMFTGLALQLAKEYGLNNPYTKNKQKLKLWYLLYVLDGQQSLTFNRQPLLNSLDYSLQNSKAILLKEQKLIKEPEKDHNDESRGNIHSITFNSDMRLVSQVEYNQALQEAFRGNAWDLLAPSAFGIPSKSNLELDKWMVSWTVCLAPGYTGAVWSSKSTMIYYNFAKMHINSRSVRQLQVKPGDKSILPQWNALQDEELSSEQYSSDEESEDDSDSEFVSNKEYVSEDASTVSSNIAMGAASTVLNLVINDKDIIDNLKYVPVHIHIMLYYAALLTLNPPSKSLDKSVEIDETAQYLEIMNNIRVITTFQHKIQNNSPIDTSFGQTLISSLASAVEDKMEKIDLFIQSMPEGEEKDKVQKKYVELMQNAGSLEVVEESDGSPGPESISAWPGSDHGHP